MELLEWMESNKRQSKTKLTDYKYFELCFVGGVCVLSLIAGIIYVLMSKTVYFWDSATYWDISRLLEAKPLNLTFFKEVYTSIGTSDYNYFVALPVALWMKVFGVTRVSYIVALVFFYLAPAQVMIYLIAKKISGAPRSTFVLTILFIPSLWYLAVIGFIDVAGALVGLLCYYIYFTDFLEKKPYIKSVVLGILFVLIMIIRRYFAFFSVSFITVMAIDSILFKRNIKQFIVMLISVMLSLLILFNGFLFNILLKDYGALYAGYKYSFFTDLKLLARYFGIVFLVALICSVPYYTAKKRDLRGIFALLQIFVCAAMFVSTQTHGQQHLLLYVPAFVVIIMLAINCIKKQWATVLVCCLALLNGFSPCINRVQPQNIREIRGLSPFPSYSVEPAKRKDINSVLALRYMLDKKIPESSKCGILSSSFVLNSSVLINVVPSLNMKETRTDSYIVGLPEVDSRDYWRLNEIYECDYILVATPAQTHLSPEQQTIVTQAVKSFSENTDIARAFSQIPDFMSKIGSVDVKLYKRVSPVTETAKTEFQMKLYK